jgi:hypothetical protein
MPPTDPQHPPAADVMDEQLRRVPRLGGLLGCEQSTAAFRSLGGARAQRVDPVDGVIVDI